MGEGNLVTKKNILHFKLFGHPEIYLDGNVLNFSFAKVNALLYYLAVNKTGTRDEISGLLWPDKTDKSAKKNLRNTIYQANKAIGMECIETPNNKVLVLSDKMKITSDVDCFMSKKTNDLNAYVDVFLKGFYIKDSEEFDFWLVKMRSFYEKKFVQDSFEAIKKAFASKQYDTIEKNIYKLIAIDEFDERNYQLLMTLYQDTNRNSKVIEVYYQLVALLERELGIAPSKETRYIYEKTLQIVNRAKKKQTKKNQTVYLSRYAEMEKIETIVNQIFNGEKTSTIVINGMAGLGKSVLVQSVLGHISQDCISLQVLAERHEKPYYLRPFKKIFEQLADYVEQFEMTLPNQWKSVYTPLFEQDSEKVNYKTIDDIETILITVLERLQQELPLILFFDDIHWMDQESIQLLNRLIVHCKDKRVQFLIGVQPHSDRHLENMLNYLSFNQLSQTIDLYPFTLEETTRFLKKQTDVKALTDENIRFIHEEAEGVPFYVEEYMNALNRGLPLDKLTFKMQEFLREQFSHLSDEQVELLTLCAYFQEDIPESVIVELSEQDELTIAESLDLCISQAILSESIVGEDTLLRFTHRKYREYLYTKQTYTKKRMIHKKIAQTLANRREQHDMHVIAYHYEQAKLPLDALVYRINDLQRYMAINYQIFPLYQLNQPLRHEYQRYDEFKALQEQIEVLEEEYNDNKIYQLSVIKFLLLEGCFLIRNGRYEEGLLAIQQVIAKSELIKNTDYLAEAYRQMIYYYIQVDNASSMYEFVQKALHLSTETNNYEEMGIVLRLLGLYYLMVGDYEQSKKQLQESIHIFSITDILATKYMSNIAAANDYLAEIERISGRYDEALTLHERSLLLSRDDNMTASRIVFYINKGITLFAQKYYAEAKVVFELAKTLLSDVSPIWKQMQLDIYYALSCFYQGESQILLDYLMDIGKQEANIANPRDLGLLYVAKACLVQFQQSQELIHQKYPELYEKTVQEYRDLAQQHLNRNRDSVELALLNELI